MGQIYNLLQTHSTAERIHMESSAIYTEHLILSLSPPWIGLASCIRDLRDVQVYFVRVDKLILNKGEREGVYIYITPVGFNNVVKLPLSTPSWAIWKVVLDIGGGGGSSVLQEGNIKKKCKSYSFTCLSRWENMASKKYHQPTSTALLCLTSKAYFGTRTMYISTVDSLRAGQSWKKKSGGTTKYTVHHHAQQICGACYWRKDYFCLYILWGDIDG